ncbi:hypothetical protein IFR04_008974 [Cadophora malorum]|uniref:NADP-dependent oxidoreductase domain-containing protein n=1 Tax=Cadophora malorum TaxID=108018 RepID=A0A8H7TF12_9HELO|nr:hypothetical protein IFR04_008974 [Cadophora malorum]
MSPFDSPPKPTKPLAYHRILSPTCSIKVSPLCLGGISIGSSWSSMFGENEEPFCLLDAYYSSGGNLIDTASIYNSKASESLIGEWMEKRGNRDEMVIATKYTAAKNLHISLRDSLKKLRTDYIDILFVHWWDFGTSVEEIMTHLHAAVMSKQVLYLGVSNAPAWVVVKANEYARHNGMTPFSVYEAKWNATQRDAEAEIVPMCEDQGMGVMTFATLGGGSILTAKERAEKAEASRKPKNGERVSQPLTEDETKICEVLEAIAEEKKTSIQAIACAYLFSQTTYVIPIIGMQSVKHVEDMSSFLEVQLSPLESKRIQTAAKFDPRYPLNFAYQFKGNQEYHLGLTTRHNQQYQMAAYVNATPKQGPYGNLEALPEDH